MSQEYTEEKEITLKHVSSGRRFYEALLIAAALFAIYLMIALISFDAADPSWSQTAWHEPIKNIGGKTGAWLADTLFFVFGVLAYIVPPLILILCCYAYHKTDNQGYTDYFSIGLRLIGLLALILASCGLASLNADDLYYFSSGGVIGSLLSNAFIPTLGAVGGTLALMAMWAMGLTLFSGWSWLNIAEKIGGVLMGGLTFMGNRQRNSDYDYEEEYEEEEETPFSSKSYHSEAEAYGFNENDDTIPASKVNRDDTDDILLSPPVRKGPAPAFDDSDPRFSHITQQQARATLFAEHAALHSVDANAAERDITPSVAQQIEPTTVTVGGVNPHTLSEKDLDEILFSKSVSAIESSASGQGEGSVAEVASSTIHFEPAATFTPPVEEIKIKDPPVGLGNTVFNQIPAEKMTLRPEFAAQRSAEDRWQERIPSLGEAAPGTAQARIETVEPIHIESSRRDIAKIASELEQDRWQERVPSLGDRNNYDADADSHLSSPVSAASNKFGAEPTTHPAFNHVVDPQFVEPIGGTGSPAAKQAAKIAAGAAAAATFMPALGAESQSQVKEGFGGPELPRPNRVRVPTRRELASNVFRPSLQRMAEERVRMEDEARRQHEIEASLFEQPVRVIPPATEQPVTPEMDEEQWREQEALRRAYAAQQQQRYGDEYGYDQDGEETQEQTGLQNKGVAQQQQPYQTTEYDDAWQDEQAHHYGSSRHEATQQPYSAEDSVPYFSAANSDEHEEAFAASVTHHEQQPGKMEGLIHPFLVRNDQPLQKPTTPLPSLDLLAEPPVNQEPVDMGALAQLGQLIETRLADYRIKANVVGYAPGPVITRFELDLAPGVKAARISNLSRDLARSLSTLSVRVVEVIPGKPYVGLELPNKHRQTVYLREVLDCPKFRESTSPLTVVLGKDISGQPVVADLAKMPHLLVAGTTGSGKSVGVNAMILSILYKAKPEDVRFIMIDPKMLELSVYEGIPHLLTEVVTDMKDAANALRWSVAEMERRYKLMSALGVRNLAGYNEKVQQAIAMGRPVPDPFWKPTDSMDVSPTMLEKLPYIVVMVDEFADLMMVAGKKVEELIARLAQKARAAGIHLVLATQRPSVDVITGLIKANIPTRIAFTVSSKIDSRTIIDQGGAESLLGMGDMLYMPPNSSMPVRVHGAFVRDEEVHAVVNDWKARGRPQYIDSIVAGGDEGEGSGAGFDGDEPLDDLFDQAVAFVLDKRRASISGVQRQFRIGYNRAARIIEQMEAQGIVSSPNNNGNRELLARTPNDYE